MEEEEVGAVVDPWGSTNTADPPPARLRNGERPPAITEASRGDEGAAAVVVVHVERRRISVPAYEQERGRRVGEGVSGAIACRRICVRLAIVDGPL